MTICGYANAVNPRQGFHLAPIFHSRSSHSGCGSQLHEAGCDGPNRGKAGFPLIAFGDWQWSGERSRHHRMAGLEDDIVFGQLVRQPGNGIERIIERLGPSSPGLDLAVFLHLDSEGGQI